MAAESQNRSANASPVEGQRLVRQLRLEQPLPPVPEIRLQIPYQFGSPLSAYTDDSTTTSAIQHSAPVSKESRRASSNGGCEAGNVEGQRSELPPPEYEPRHDYLLALALHRQERSSRYYSPTSNTFLSPSSHPQTPVLYTPCIAYRDALTSPTGERAFFVTLSPLSPSGAESEPLNPPSYEELYLQHPCPDQQSRLMELVRQMDGTEMDVAEEVFKFVMGLIFVLTSVIVIGVIFNWGRSIPAPANHVPAVSSTGIATGHPSLHDVARTNIEAMSRIRHICGGRCKITV